MLKRLFSEHGKHKRYALCCAILSFGYLLIGYVAAKQFFLGENAIPGWKSLAGIAVGAMVFSLMHIRSMRDLDHVRRAPSED